MFKALFDRVRQFALPRPVPAHSVQPFIPRPIGAPIAKGIGDLARAQAVPGHDTNAGAPRVYNAPMPRPGSSVPTNTRDMTSEDPSLTQPGRGTGSTR